LLFALDRDFSLRDPFLLRRVLASGLKPEMLSPPEFFGMLADPSFGLCDPKLVGKVFDGTKENLTKEEIEVRPTILSITTFSIRTFSIRTFSIMPFGISIFSIRTFS
jgi:hypothetical protein